MTKIICFLNCLAHWPKSFCHHLMFGVCELLTFQSSPETGWPIGTTFAEIMFRRSFHFDWTVNMAATGILVSEWLLCKKSLHIWYYSAHWNETLLKWCLDGPLQKFLISLWTEKLWKHMTNYSQTLQKWYLESPLQKSFIYLFFFFQWDKNHGRHRQLCFLIVIVLACRITSLDFYSLWKKNCFQCVLSDWKPGN